MDLINNSSYNMMPELNSIYANTMGENMHDLILLF